MLTCRTRRFLLALVLAALGVFCLFGAPFVLSSNVLPARYDDLAQLGQIFPVVGLVVIIIAVGVAVRKC